MALEQDVKGIKDRLGILEKEADNHGNIHILSTLILTAGIGGLYVCNLALQDNKDELKPQAHTSNVLGAEAPEKFYNVDGQRVYLEIDGKPVEQYARGGN